MIIKRVYTTICNCIDFPKNDLRKVFIRDIYETQVDSPCESRVFAALKNENVRI